MNKFFILSLIALSTQLLCCSCATKSIALNSSSLRSPASSGIMTYKIEDAGEDGSKITFVEIPMIVASLSEAPQNSEEASQTPTSAYNIKGSYENLRARLINDAQDPNGNPIDSGPGDVKQMMLDNGAQIFLTLWGTSAKISTIRVFLPQRSTEPICEIENYDQYLLLPRYKDGNLIFTVSEPASESNNELKRVLKGCALNLQ